MVYYSHHRSFRLGFRISSSMIDYSPMTVNSRVSIRTITCSVSAVIFLFFAVQLLLYEPVKLGAASVVDKKNWSRKNASSTTTAVKIENETSQRYISPVIQRTDTPLPFDACWRNCSHRRNKLILGEIFPAGLNDRHSVIGALVNLGGYLCATVYIPPPYSLLSAHHNHGIRLDVNVTWPDLVDYNFLPTGEPSVQQYSVEKVDALMIDGDTNLTVITRSAGSIATDFAQVERYSFAQQQQEQSSAAETTNWTSASAPFVWKIALKRPRTMYSTIQVFARYLQSLKKNRAATTTTVPLPSFTHRFGGCNYGDIRSPPLLQHLAEDLIHKIQPESASSTVLGYLHVRRGDAIRECDTSLPTLTHYLKCSLVVPTTNNSTSFATANLTIFFSSDEQDPIYRTSVQNIPKNESSLAHVEILDLDALCRDQIRSAIENQLSPPSNLNNYFLFSLISEVRKRTTFSLERRRMICRQCTNVQASIEEAIIRMSERQ